MEKETKNDKSNNNLSIEKTIKTLSKCIVLICILLIILIIRVEKANGYLRTIAENGTNIIEYETFDDTFIEVETNDNKQKEDYVPLLEEVTTETSTKVKENISKETTTDSNTSTHKTDDDVSTDTYVLNTSSKKIHLANCSFVGRTKEENKKIVKLSENELQEYINNGYTKCKTCGGN